VQCCECRTFQSQIVKKVPKFSCALCGTKQSVRQVMSGCGPAQACCLRHSRVGISSQTRCMLRCLYAGVCSEQPRQGGAAGRAAPECRARMPRACGG